MARRSGLGKGLGALIPTETVGDRGTALREVPISSIRPNPLQPRTLFDEEAMASLAASIRELGVLQPVLVRTVEDGSESYELIAGERRWRGARRAGLQTIPVLVQTPASDAHSLEQALVENLHRADLNALEEAAAYPAADRRFRPHPRTGGHASGEEQGVDHQHPAAPAVAGWGAAGPGRGHDHRRPRPSPPRHTRPLDARGAGPAHRGRRSHRARRRGGRASRSAARCAGAPGPGRYYSG